MPVNSLASSDMLAPAPSCRSTQAAAHADKALCQPCIAPSRGAEIPRSTPRSAAQVGGIGERAGQHRDVVVLAVAGQPELHGDRRVEHRVVMLVEVATGD